MSVDEVIKSVREAVSKCTGSERELYNELMSEAAGWEMRLQELEDEE